MNSTPALEASAKEKFEKLHPEHKKPGTQKNWEVKFYPAQFTHHMRVICECGYLERYTERELTAPRVRVAGMSSGPEPFRSSTKEYKGPGRR